VGLCGREPEEIPTAEAAGELRSLARAGRVHRAATINLAEPYYSVGEVAHSLRRPAESDHGFVGRPRRGRQPGDLTSRRGQRFPAGDGSGAFPRLALSVTPGNKRRTSMATDSSPPCSYAERIAAAASSVTTNITGSMGRHAAAGKAKRRGASAPGICATERSNHLPAP
jgi:hypothetical protein